MIREQTLTECRAAMAVDDSASFYVDEGRRWTRNASGQIMFDGEPLFLIMRAQWGDDATPAATLYGIEAAVIALLNAERLVP